MPLAFLRRGKLEGPTGFYLNGYKMRAQKRSMRKATQV